MKGKVWSTISKPVKDLIRKMMCIDPVKRISAIQALDHEWFYLGTDPQPTYQLTKLNDNPKNLPENRDRKKDYILGK